MKSARTSSGIRPSGCPSPGLRVDVQPRDGVGSAPYTHYVAAYNAFANNTIYAGGDRASYLLVPIIPPKAA